MNYDNLNELEGVWCRKINSFGDSRGEFKEIFEKKLLPVEVNFVLSSISFSNRNVFRGMHLQKDQWQLVTVLNGSVLDLLIDSRKHSNTYGEVTTIELSAEAGYCQLLIPPGIFHGYLVKSEFVTINYMSSEYYLPMMQSGINYMSPEILSKLPQTRLTVSKRDKSFNYYNDVMAKLKLN